MFLLFHDLYDWKCIIICSCDSLKSILPSQTRKFSQNVFLPHYWNCKFGLFHNFVFLTSRVTSYCWRPIFRLFSSFLLCVPLSQLQETWMWIITLQQLWLAGLGTVAWKRSCHWRSSAEYATLKMNLSNSKFPWVLETLDGLWIWGEKYQGLEGFWKYIWVIEVT